MSSRLKNPLSIRYVALRALKEEPSLSFCLSSSCYPTARMLIWYFILLERFFFPICSIHQWVHVRKVLELILPMMNECSISHPKTWPCIGPTIPPLPLLYLACLSYKTLKEPVQSFSFLASQSFPSFLLNQFQSFHLLPLLLMKVVAGI